MSTIVGLGSAGCSIANEFAKYPQYTIYKIDVGLEGENCYNLPIQANHEDYEKNCPQMDEFFKGVSGEVLFALGGSGTISGAALRVLSHLKGCRVGVLYIKPDYELLSETRRLQERVVCGILQEYARSAVFERIYLISNQSLEEVLGAIPVVEYYDKLNTLLVTTIHMLNVFKNTEPLTNTFSAPVPSARIMTLGVFNPETGEEKMFFPLDSARQKRYYYGISQEVLKTDGSLLRRVKERTKSEKTKASYGIYQTQYNKNYGYIISYSSKVQLDNADIKEYNID